MNPVPIDHIFGLFVLVPVVGCNTITPNQKIANISLADWLIMFIGDLCFVTRHQLSRTPWLNLAWTVANEDVQDFGATDAIENLDMEFLLPASQNVGRKGFTGRDTDTHGREIEAFLCIGQGKHTSIERRHTIEDSRAVLLDYFEHILWDESPRMVHGARTNTHGKVEIVAEAIGEVELCGREGDVTFLNAEDRFSVAFSTVGHIMLQVDTAFGETCAAGAIQPESAIIFARLGSFQVRRSLHYPLVKVMEGCCLLFPFLFQADNHYMMQVLELRENLPNLLPEYHMDKQHTRTTVIEHVDIVIGTQYSV